MKFMAYIRKHKTSYGEYGTMTNKHLAEYADKLVLVSVEIVTSDTRLPPVKVKGIIKERQTPSAPQTISPG